MATVNLDEMGVNLYSLLERVEAGEEVTIARNGKPVAKLTPVRERVRGKRQFGSMKGLIKFDDSFFDPLPEEGLKAWEGG